MANELTTHEKASKMDGALRIERDMLRANGGSDDLKASNAINTYLNEADENSKARFFDILTAAD